MHLFEKTLPKTSGAKDYKLPTKKRENTKLQPTMSMQILHD
jgi:hypothetical protein